MGKNVPAPRAGRGAVLRGSRDSSDRRARGGARRVALLATALATVFVAVGASSGCVARTERFELALIGDLPYTPEDEAKFPALIEEMNAEDLEFVVHVGDIAWSPRTYEAAGRVGTDPCADKTLVERKALYNTSAHPFIITPGDNDWADCVTAEPPRDPIEHLARFRQVFYPGERSLGQRAIVVDRQSEDPRYVEFRENARWVMGDVVFVTLHTVGGNNNLGRGAATDAEFEERNAANLVWLKQAFELAKRDGREGVMILTQADPYFHDRWLPARQESLHVTPTVPPLTGYAGLLDTLERETIAFGKPVVYVHGDTHYFRVDKPLVDSTRKRMIENFTRVEVFGTPDVDWVRATIDSADPQVFTFTPEIVENDGTGEDR